MIQIGLSKINFHFVSVLIKQFLPPHTNFLKTNTIILNLFPSNQSKKNIAQ